MFGIEKIKPLQAILERWQQEVMHNKINTDKLIDNLTERIFGLENIIFVQGEKIECQARQLQLASEALLKMTAILEGMKPKPKPKIKEKAVGGGLVKRFSHKSNMKDLERK